MPTAYTEGIETGEITTGKDFLMICARAMGACISLMDEPLDTPIPDKFVGGRYYHEAMLRAKDELERYKTMTVEEAQQRLDAAYEENQRRHQEFIDKAIANKKAYEAVRAEVLAWEPPTPEHEGLKAFALEQIDTCYRDCDTSRWEKAKTEPKQDVHEWLRRKIKSCEEGVRFNEESWNEERSRVEGRNKWIGQLRESLNGCGKISN